MQGTESMSGREQDQKSDNRNPKTEPPQRASEFGPRLTNLAMGLLIVVLVIYLLQTFATVLQELCVAVFITYLILPAHRWLVKRGVSSVLAYALMVLGFLACSFGLGTMAYNNLQDLRTNLPAYQESMDNLVRRATLDIPWVKTAHIQEFFLAEKSSVDLGMRIAQSAVGTFFGFVAQMVVVLVYLVFIMAERASFPGRIQAAFTGPRVQQIKEVANTINAGIERYIAVKTLMSFLTGAVTYAVLLVFGVDYAVFWGIVAFLLNYIPYVGSWIAVILPGLLSLVQFENPGLTLALLAVLLVLQNLIGYFVEPRIAGSRLNLSPLVIILSLAFWSTIWGIIGMILAVPLVVAVKTVLENIRETKPIATLLSNQ
jgi:predicted PurR-regulated permease PerM